MLRCVLVCTCNICTMYMYSKLTKCPLLAALGGKGLMQQTRYVYIVLTNIYEMTSLPLNYKASHFTGPHQLNSLPCQIKNEIHIYLQVGTVCLEC